MENAAWLRVIFRFRNGQDLYSQNMKFNDTDAQLLANLLEILEIQFKQQRNYKSKIAKT